MKRSMRRKKKKKNRKNIRNIKEIAFEQMYLVKKKKKSTHNYYCVSFNTDIIKAILALLVKYIRKHFSLEKQKKKKKALKGIAPPSRGGD